MFLTPILRKSIYLNVIRPTELRFLTIFLRYVCEILFQHSKNNYSFSFFNFCPKLAAVSNKTTFSILEILTTNAVIEIAEACAFHLRQSLSRRSWIQIEVSYSKFFIWCVVLHATLDF